MQLNVVRAGAGSPVVLLHGLTATHHYVVMGSRSLERSGHDVVAYDARGHGASDPADAYSYELLAADLERVMDEAGFERALLAGSSMGAHTAIRLALERPERVSGLVIITPAYDETTFGEDLDRWDSLAEGLRSGGVEGFVEAYGDPRVPERWRETVIKVLRQRLSAHDHPGALADALQQIPRSRPFEAIALLESIACPAVVVADRDDVDPGHPLAVGQRYAAAIPGCELVVEEPGASPVAWQGGRLSRLIAETAALRH